MESTAGSDGVGLVMAGKVESSTDEANKPKGQGSESDEQQENLDARS